MNGYSATQFGPSNPVTRKQFMIILSRAFYSDDVAALNTPANTRTDKFLPNYMALSNAGILRGTSFQYSYTASEIISQGINRYDMAQLMTNIMSKKGFAASDVQKSEAQAKIADYWNIPSQYQDAVKNVFALGIINGYSNGTFNGSGNMTRGAAAKVVCSMMQYKPAENPVTPNPETPSEPNPVPEGNKTITVTSSPNGNDTMWTVGDNNYPTGYLNNGDPITEENVTALINVAKLQWPQGMSWSDNAYCSTNTFDTKYAIQTEKAMRPYNMRQDGGCCGFAALINNYVFGQTNNPIRKLSDNSQARPGDIVLRINKSNGTVAHVMILTGYGTGAATGKSGFAYAEGNYHDGGADAPGTVDWSAEHGNIMTASLLANGNSANRYEVWTRYPE